MFIACSCHTCLPACCTPQTFFPPPVQFIYAHRTYAYVILHMHLILSRRMQILVAASWKKGKINLFMQMTRLSIFVRVAKRKQLEIMNDFERTRFFSWKTFLCFIHLEWKWGFCWLISTFETVVQSVCLLQTFDNVESSHLLMFLCM